jgi:hypothetical protein
VGGVLICFCFDMVAHVEQFSDKISYVTLYLVGYILEHSYDERTNEY